MSLIGWKSAAKAGAAAATVASVHGLPISAASTARARFGVAAMPPKAIRAEVTTVSVTARLKQPQIAEMS